MAATEPTSAELAQDVAELVALLASCTSPRVRAALQALLAKAQRDLDAIPRSVNGVRSSTDSASSAPATTPSGDAMDVVQPAAASKNVVYKEIESFAWDQDAYKGKNVYVHVFLDGVGALPKDAVTCEFGPKSFALSILGLNGQNLRLSKNYLEHSIEPKGSKVRWPLFLYVWVHGANKRSRLATKQFKVSKNRVTITMQKSDASQHWVHLTKVPPRDAEVVNNNKSKDDDPTSSIMDMMKEMYETGDEKTRKIIGESMLASRQGRTLDPPKPKFGGGFDDDL